MHLLHVQRTPFTCEAGIQARPFALLMFTPMSSDEMKTAGGCRHQPALVVDVRVHASDDVEKVVGPELLFVAPARMKNLGLDVAERTQGGLQLSSRQHPISS